MKRVGSFITASVLSALFAALTSGYAQNPNQPDQNKQQGRSKQQQQQDKRAQQKQRQQDNQQKQVQQQQRQQDKHVQQRAQQQQRKDQNQQRARQMQRTPQQMHQQQSDQRRVWQRYRANRWDQEHRGWQQRGGYNGYRVPDGYFRAHYGRAHWFRVYSLPFMVVGGYPRFQYGGYWISFIDPYPEYWGPNWYETDDVYVDYYRDGYYLFNRRYPGRPGIAISISF